MKVCLYLENEKMFGVSGLGKAVKNQINALESYNIAYTKDPKEDYDILHINTWMPKSIMVAKKAKKKGKKIIYHAHSTEEDFKNSFVFSNQLAPLVKKLLMKAYGYGDVLITPTPYSKSLLQGYGLKQDIYVISNGVRVKFFEKNNDNGLAFRKEYGYKDTDKIIVGIGLFLERKGISDFVEIAKRHPEYEFIWFGSTPLASIPRKTRKIVQTKLPNLKFPGHVPAETIRNALSGANLFLYTTREETEGIPIVEAAAAKLPILVRDIPIYKEWFPEDVASYKAKDVEGFERQMVDILEGRKKDLTEEAYKNALACDSELVGKQLVDVYNKVYNMEPRKVGETPFGWRRTNNH